MHGSPFSCRALTGKDGSNNLRPMSAERYWLSRSGGEVTGPHWRGRLMKMLAAGEILDTDQLCKDGTEEWTNALEELQFLQWTAPVQAPALAPVKRCKKIVIRQQTETAGVVLFIVGLLFSPCLIGIPLLIWGCMIMSTKVYGCGACGNEIAKTAGVCGVCGAVCE